MKISNNKAMRNYLYENSGFSKKTVNNVISALGYPLHGSGSLFKDLSGLLKNCAERGANCGFSGFCTSDETIAFFKANRQDIVNHMENYAAEVGIDIFSMVQGFGVFRNCTPPTAGEIGKALWGCVYREEFITLYNVFAWYALEEVARTWYRYLEDNPAIWEKLSA